MARFKAKRVVATLRALRDQVASLKGSTEIRKIVNGGDLRCAVRAVVHERDTQSSISTTMTALASEILPIDILGPYGSLDELVLRASRLVILTQVSHLQVLIKETQSRHLARPFQDWTRFANTALPFIQDELTRIDKMWMAFRPPSERSAMSDSARYRTGVAVAQFSIRELGRRAPIAKFFRDGMSHGDHVGARHPCDLMLRVLEFEINAIPDDLLISDHRLIPRQNLSSY